MSTEYTYAAAFVKSLEINMITDAEFNTALGYDENQLENLLKDKGYEGKNITEMLENERKKLHNTCLELASDDGVKDVLVSENNFHNVKAVIKAVISQSSWEDLIYKPSEIDCEAIENLIKAGDFSGTDEKTLDISRTAYGMYKESGLQAMEMLLDKLQLEEIILKSDGFVRDWAEMKALFADLKIYLRVKGASKAFLENALIENSLIDIYNLINSDKSKEEVLSYMGYKREYALFLKSPSEFEKYCDDKVTEYLQKAKTSFFSFDAVLGYFEGKKTEMKNIRLIAYAKKSGMPEGDLKERLRKTYV